MSPHPGPKGGSLTTIHVIGEFLPNWEQAGLRAAARDLTIALAETAPRGFGSSLLVTNSSVSPDIDHPKARVDTIPLMSSMLPVLWAANTAARPLDGEFMHALSPLAPIRTRVEDDGSQASVSLPHMLAWDAPEALPKGQARVLRKFTRRAIKHANVIVTCTHAAAERLRELYGDGVAVRVVPLAAPREYLAGDDAAARRQRLNLPDRYIVTSAYPGDVGRLEWILRAMEGDPDLPHLVTIGPIKPGALAPWQSLKDRVNALVTDDLADAGATIAGAAAFAAPQAASDCLFPVYGALAARVPVVHAGAGCVAETVLEAGVYGASETEFVDALREVVAQGNLADRLRVAAGDRARMFSWETSAWQIWELHANL